MNARPCSLVRALTLLSCCTLAAAASAQSVGPAQLSPWEAPSLRADAYSTRSNPAALTFVDGMHSAVVVSGIPAVDDRVAAGWSIAGGFGRIAGFGFAVEGDGDAAATSLGFGMGSDQLALGFSTTRFFSDSDRALDGFSTTRLSLAARASNNLGASFAIHELTTPRLGGVPVPRRYVPAVGVRSSNGSIEFDARFEAVDGEPDANRVGATVVTRPVSGLRLFFSASTLSGDVGEDLAASAGLELTGGNVSATGAVRMADGADGTDLGFVAAVEFSSEPAPGFARRDRFVRVDLAGDFDEIPRATLLHQRGDAFVDVLLELDAIARDPRVGGVFLSMGGLNAPTAQLYELRQAVRRIQASGKTVVAFFEQATVRDLYVAGGADVRIVDPNVSVISTGVGVTRTYFAELLGRLGMPAHFVRIGDYKSGPERFTESGPTEQANAQLDAFLDDVWQTLVEGIADNLGYDTERTEAWLASAPLDAASLERDGFADAVLYRDELSDRLDELVGRAVNVVDERQPGTRGVHWVDPNRIAVVHIAGAIVAGESRDGLFGPQTGSETIAEVCRALADDNTIRGVIVRIASPGGSAVASDRIHRALHQLSEHKPVVVSMGGVAASGGMYAAAFGRPIHASPTTLTGSIGIYAGTVELDGFLNRVGINRVHDDRGGASDLFDGRAWSEDDEARVYAHIESAYGRFVSAVAEGRGLSEDEVDAIGQGRIWSGLDAVGVGLVDSLDGFLGALAAVRVDAGIREGAPVTLHHYPRPRPNVFTLMPNAPRAAARVGWSDVVRELGLAPVLALLGPLVSEPDGAPMAQLEWVVEGL